MLWPVMKLDRALLGLYAAALVPRLALIIGKAASGDTPVFLSAGRDLPFWDILPVVFFRTLHQLTGHHLVIVALLYALPAAAIAPVVRQIAGHLGLSRAVALGTGLGAAFYPYYVSTAWFQPEVGVTILLTAVTTLAFLCLGRRASWSRGVLACGSGVLLLLDRPDAVVFVLFTAFMATRASRARLHVGIVLGSAVLLAFGTIGFVNARSSGRFSPMPGKSAYNLLLGHNSAVNSYLRTNHATTMETFVIGTAFAGFPAEVQADKQNAAYSGLYRQRALAFIRAHPGLTLVNTGYKLLRYWDWRLEDADREGAVKNAIYSGSYLLVLVLALLGTIRLARYGSRDALLYAWGAMLALSLPGLVTIPLIRVRMYAEFLLIALAASGLEGLLGRRARGTNGL
jgi:hypothetical protein